MHTVELPALDGRDPLGFLAALGLLRLVAEETSGDARLSFSDTTARALLHSRFVDTQALADTLAAIVERIPPDGVLPAADPAIPRAKNGSGPDPMRGSRAEFAALYQEVRARDPHTADTWLPALVTDLALDNQGRTAHSPFMAPAGQQSLRTFVSKPLDAVRSNPSTLHEALTDWRRYEGFTGEYLDHRALNSAADHPSGRSVMAGVPGATWLATMALPLFRHTGDGQRSITTGWHRHNRVNYLIWPLWTPRLGVAAVQVLLDHPALRPIPEADEPTLRSGPLTALGIFAVAAARRRPIDGGKSAGVLAPTRITTT